MSVLIRDLRLLRQPISSSSSSRLFSACGIRSYTRIAAQPLLTPLASITAARPQQHSHLGLGPAGQRRWRSTSSGSFFENLPGPIRTILPVMGTAGLLFFVAAPALLVFLPPMVLGALFLLRRARRQRAALFEKRWTEMASYHLTYQSEQAALNEQDTLKRLVMRRVAEAIQDNENGIAKRLGFIVPSTLRNPNDERELQAQFQRSHLALGDIRSIEEDWRVSAQGIAQGMTVYTLALEDKNRDNLKVADVDIVVKARVGNANRRTKDVRIEVNPAVGIGSQRFVLEGATGDGEGEIIDIKKRR
ncbi:hypothetical protein D0Z00_004020 [Geotrichum galactomycetum]|uniref:Uncharacterized protein n=1 Tax=Geotrichum galactomycetum TaxID=27317 RepID=A0ACB6UZN5_9ASCO|nr:hypothetical protein D0Z00_004020 [Geotrichum candidum]